MVALEGGLRKPQPLQTETQRETREEREFRIAQNEILRMLEQDGLVYEREDGVLVVDINALFAMNIGDFNKRIESRRNVQACPEFVHQSKQRLLFNAFKDKEVISTVEDNMGVGEPKPLFYSPKTEEESLNIESIKAAQFYCVPWEVKTTDPKQHERTYPGLPKEATLSAADVALACLTYHPNYGDGVRDKKSVLHVRDARTRRHKPVSSDFFVKEMHFPGKITKGDRAISMNSPALYLAEAAPRVREAGLLRIEDFTIASTSAAGQQFRIERAKKVQDKALVTFDGIRYYLGRGFKDKTIKMVKISESLGGVTEVDPQGNERLTHVFDLLSPEERKKKTKPGVAYDVGGEQTNLRPYNPGDFAQKRSDEDDTQYADRLKRIENFDAFFRFSRQLSTQAGLNLSKMDFQTQLWASSFANDMAEHRISGYSEDTVIGFAKTYGATGIRALLSAEYGTDMGERVIMIGTFQPEAARSIFTEYSLLADEAERFADALSNDSQEKQQIMETLLHRGKEFLVAASFVAHGDESAPLSLPDVARIMKQYREFLVAQYTQSETADDITTNLDIQSLQHNPELVSIIDAHLEQQWMKQIRKQRELNDLYDVSRITEAFYSKYLEMNSNASETTGDTARERSRLLKFLQQEGVQPRRLLDAGCGDGKRITESVAQALPETAIVGVDLLAPEDQSHDNVHYERGDLTRLDTMQNGSFDVVMSNWSVVNDILRREDQMSMFRRLSELLQDGGYLIIDVPWLEGGEGSWSDAAAQFQAEHPDEGYPFGMIEAVFERPNGERLVKKFDIYPMHDLRKLLADCGLTIRNMPTAAQEEAVRSGQVADVQGTADADSPMTSPVWRTRGAVSKPRITIIAQKTGRPRSTVLSFGSVTRQRKDAA